MAETIYLDYNATTPVDPLVLDTMLPFFSTSFANAASITHAPGRLAANAVENAREQISQLIHCESNEIIFTSGSTESINTAIKGVGKVYRSKGNHIITWQTEHKAVLETCDSLEKEGFKITKLGVSREGLPDPEEFEKHITDQTILVCAMLANNETGVVFPIHEIAAITHKHAALLFCDATQGPGKMRIDVQDLGADLLCISAHKMYGPKGAGALFVRRKNPRVKLEPLLVGGGHENGLRAGTLNVPAIAGFGKAALLCQDSYWDDTSKLSYLRTILEQSLTDNGRGYVNGSMRDRIPNTSNICFNGIRASDLITKLPNYAIATGSACSSAQRTPSHVLSAMGLTEAESFASVRFSLGRFTTKAEIEAAIGEIIPVIDSLKKPT